MGEGCCACGVRHCGTGSRQPRARALEALEPPPHLPFRAPPPSSSTPTPIPASTSILPSIYTFPASPTPADITMSHTTNYVPPSQLSKLRACMICSFIQTYQKFRTEGCPNCDDIPEIDYQDNADEITSPIYEGMIALRDPERSWVARWQRVNTAKSGVYAVKVVGNVSAL